MIFQEISNQSFDGLRVSSHPEFQHEKVYLYEDSDTNIRSIVAIHSTKLGPAIGGCRFQNYSNFLDGLNDVLRLSRGMTEKNIAANVPFGGGKAIIFANNIQKTDKLLKSFADFLNLIGGDYLSAEDIGITLEDIQTVGKFSRHVFDNVDPSSYTAKGIFYAIEKVLTTHNTPLKNATIGIQGAGNVGLKLANLLLGQGSCVYISDTNQDKLFEAKKLGCIVSNDIFSEKIDVFSPCAVGGILNEINISKLKAKYVIGGANNQLLTPKSDLLLHNKNIIYVPDAMINAGGVIGLTKDVLNRTEEDLDQELRSIGTRVESLLKRANELNSTPYQVFIKEVLTRSSY